MSSRHKINDQHTQEAYHKACEALGSEKAAQKWMHEDNRFLGGESPMSMIGKGRAKDLNKMIDSLRPNKVY